MKRFYSTVTVDEAADRHYRILLDKRPVQTPERAELTVASRPLAEAVAAEWDAQEARILPRSMPLTQLAITKIDHVAKQRGVMHDSLMGYARTDLTCYLADSPEALHQRQRQHWDHARGLIEQRCGARLRTTTAIRAVAQPTQSLDTLSAAIAALPDARFNALQATTRATSSIVLGLCLEGGLLTAAQVYEAALVDEHFQLGFWGEEADASARMQHIYAELAAVERYLALL